MRLFFCWCFHSGMFRVTEAVSGLTATVGGNRPAQGAAGSRDSLGRLSGLLGWQL